MTGLCHDDPVRGIILAGETSGTRLHPIFAYSVAESSAYGVAAFGANGSLASLKERPKTPKSNYAVPGSYFYDNAGVAIARNLPSGARGGHEITDVNRTDLEQGRLQVHALPCGTASRVTGRCAQMTDAADYVGEMERRTALRIGVPQVSSRRQRFLTRDELPTHAKTLVKSGDRTCLLDLLDSGRS